MGLSLSRNVGKVLTTVHCVIPQRMADSCTSLRQPAVRPLFTIFGTYLKLGFYIFNTLKVSSGCVNDCHMLGLVLVWLTECKQG